MKLGIRHMHATDPISKVVDKRNLHLSYGSSNPSLQKNNPPYSLRLSQGLEMEEIKSHSLVNYIQI